TEATLWQSRPGAHRRGASAACGTANAAIRLAVRDSVAQRFRLPARHAGPAAARWAFRANRPRTSSPAAPSVRRRLRRDPRRSNSLAAASGAQPVRRPRELRADRRGVYRTVGAESPAHPAFAQHAARPTGVRRGSVGSASVAGAFAPGAGLLAALRRRAVARATVAPSASLTAGGR